MKANVNLGQRKSDFWLKRHRLSVCIKKNNSENMEFTTDSAKSFA